MLKVRRVCLGFTGGAKGIVSGGISIYNGNERIFNGGNNRRFGIDLFKFKNRNCENVKWVIPQKIKFVLIIEKLSVFDCIYDSSWIKNNCILITGCGYPSLLCRELIHSLYAQMKGQGRYLPMFCLVDYDPHGIDIFLSYQQGSVTAPESYLYAVPNLVYLGIEWQDITRYGMEKRTLDMNTKDYQKVNVLKSFLNRKKTLYFNGYNKKKSGTEYLVFNRLCKQLEMLKRYKRKMEIDSIDINKLVTEFLPRKILQIAKVYDLPSKGNSQSNMDIDK